MNSHLTLITSCTSEASQVRYLSYVKFYVIVHACIHIIRNINEICCMEFEFCVILIRGVILFKFQCLLCLKERRIQMNFSEAVSRICGLMEPWLIGIVLQNLWMCTSVCVRSVLHSLKYTESNFFDNTDPLSLG